MRRMTLIALCLLFPSAAIAAPVTFTFSAGDVSGWYTFDSATQGQHRIVDDTDYGMRYTNAITEFVIHVGDFWSASGTEGDIDLGIDRGELGETWYLANMWSGPDVRLLINIWAPSGDNPISSESLLDAEVPNTSIEGNFNETTLFDEQRINIARHSGTTSLARATVQTPDVSAFRSFSSFRSSFSAAPTEAVAPQTTAVPEPSTILMLAMGFAAAVVRRHRPI